MTKALAPLIIAFTCAVPLTAQAQNLLALPGDNGLALWDTQAVPPVITLDGVTGGPLGTCYSYSERDNTLTPAADVVGCLNYLVKSDEALSFQQNAYDLAGTVKFMTDPIGELYKGFEITGVAGVDDCGERDGCDRIFIQGVTSPDLLGPLVAAARSGAPVNVTGPAVWNLESLDIVIHSMQ